MTMSLSFPKNIFQVWYQGCDKISKKEFLTNIENWKLLNPDWNYYCLDDTTLSKACKEFSDECYQLYQSCSTMHMKIDLARYVLIYLYGGIYLDIDAYILRPLKSSTILNNLIKTYEENDTHVIGLSTLKINQLESFLIVQKNKMVNNAIMISSPKNPVLKRYIEYTLQQIKKNKNSNWNFTSFFSVNSTTGPISFNNFFGNEDNLKDSKIFYFPPSTFEPCDIGNNCSIREETISIHLFEMSWLSPFMKGLTKFYYTIKPYLLPILVIILIVLLFLFTKLRIFNFFKLK